MTEKLVVTIAQFNPTVGDIKGNSKRIEQIRSKSSADIVVFPELAICGYSPEDLVSRHSFLKLIEEEIEKLAKVTADGGPAMLIGTPLYKDEKCYNAAVFLSGGKIEKIIYKHHLPNFGVFDEVRNFTAGYMPEPFEFKGIKLGVMICRDIWEKDVAAYLKNAGAELFIVINASPYEHDKDNTRLETVLENIEGTGIPLVYANMTGGQDELVFDGSSFALDNDGSLKVHLPAWKETTEDVVLTRENGKMFCVKGHIASQPCDNENIYQAMMLGLRDYVNKNGFPGVIIGMSGGIDSALSAAVAVDALGSDRVRCVMMPSPYTSKESLEDASSASEMLGVKYDIIGIKPAMNAFSEMLGDIFKGRSEDVTEENIQARSRGLTLMAISNKFGHMVLSTGNKSEVSVGYATLYGDMCGGYSVLKDVYKTDVFAVSHWRNENLPEEAMGKKGSVMPERIITKPPSAELKPDQKDEDSLPPYDVLDAILKSFIEEELGIKDTVAKGYDEETVKRVWKLLNISEYKRRQAPPGVKITSLSFGRERRYPITNAFGGV